MLTSSIRTRVRSTSRNASSTTATLFSSPAMTLYQHSQSRRYSRCLPLHLICRHLWHRSRVFSKRGLSSLGTCCTTSSAGTSAHAYDKLLCIAGTSLKVVHGEKHSSVGGWILARTRSIANTRPCHSCPTRNVALLDTTTGLTNMSRS